MFTEFVVVGVMCLVFLAILLCSTGMIRRGWAIGIRTPGVANDDRSWRVGHRAALVPMGTGVVAAGVVLVIRSAARSSPITAVLVAILVGSLLVATACAEWAARRDSDRRRAAQSVEVVGLREQGAARANMAGRVFACAILWIPAVALVLMYSMLTNVPTRLPTHWSESGPADSFETSAWVFWFSFGPAIACAIVGTLVVIASGRGDWSVGGAAGFGALAVVATAVSLQWLVDALTAMMMSAGADGSIARPFLLYLAAIPVGAVAFALCLPSVQSTRAASVE